jgi:hypothetical protein
MRLRVRPCYFTTAVPFIGLLSLSYAFLPLSGPAWQAETDSGTPTRDPLPWEEAIKMGGEGALVKGKARSLACCDGLHRVVADSRRRLRLRWQTEAAS